MGLGDLMEDVVAINRCQRFVVPVWSLGDLN